MWKYDSPIGTLYIKRLTTGLYALIYDGVIWETCNTPQAEADNVFCQCTGCADWDMYDVSNIYVPTDLSEWDTC